ncbi:MAG TPA: SH3 domain-containing protein [Candidatus Limnocylindrales bacterium]|nr:SH3 domain-containing protein [Candidatus Limnocylindrales bacterium]
MEPTHENKPAETSSELITQAQITKVGLKPFRFLAWAGKIMRGRIFTLAALSLLALSGVVVVSGRQELRFAAPLLDRFFSRPSSNQIAVLAVDVHQMTIRGRNISAAAREHLEQAAVEQLDQLHHIYAGWVATDEEAVGSMLLKLQVNGAGKVVRIEPLRSRLSSGDFAKVVFEEIRQWSFPVPAAQPVEITMPLLFVPKDLDANTVMQWERRTRGASQAEQKVAKLVYRSPLAAAPRATIAPAEPISANAKPESRHHVSNANDKRANSPKPTFLLVKTTQAVALRQQPRFAAERFQEIDAETELNLLERKGDWLKVRMADAGAVGFVRKEYLTPVN